METSRRIIEKNNVPSTSNYFPLSRQTTDLIENDPVQAVTSSFERDTDMTVTTTQTKNDLPNDKVVLTDDGASSKAKNLNTVARNARFSDEEDQCLRAGIEKHGKKALAMILKDKQFRFHETLCVCEQRLRLLRKT